MGREIGLREASYSPFAARASIKGTCHADIFIKWAAHLSILGPLKRLVLPSGAYAFSRFVS